MTKQALNGTNGFSEPNWFQVFKASYASAQAFILHLNTSDYVVPGVRLPAYLAKKLAARDVIAFYDRARGITFPLASMEARAKELLNMNEEPDELLAALGQVSSTGGGEWPKAPGTALPLLEALLQTDAKVTVVIEYAETLLPAADLATMSPDDRNVLITLARWGTDKRIEQNGNIAFLITQNLADLHPVLRSASNCYKAIEIPLPDLEARRQFIEWYLEVRPIPMAMSTDELARATAGLSLVHIENIFLQAEVGGQVTWVLVRQTKNDIIAVEYAGLLEMLDPDFGFEAVGGMEPLKAWAQTEIIAPVRQGTLQDVPQGVILVGPPGTGKTFFVRALAKEIGFNAVALSMENILGGIVGTSERNLARALSVVRSLSPVLLFMDEIDQSDVSSRGNSSGNPVAKNLFSQLLRFLSEPANRGKVVFMAASNRPDLIDPAFMRFGRVDAIIPVMLPGEADRQAIALAHAKGQNVDLGPEVAAYIAERTDSYSAADIAAVVTKARKIARRQARDGIIGADAMTALDVIRPATVRQAQYFEMLAVDACNDAELLPPKYAKLLENRQQLADKIEEVAPAPRRKREL